MLAVINFSMDYLSLYITSKIMHLPSANKKTVLSAAVGALYSVGIVAISPNGSITAILSILASLLMTYIAYGRQPFAKFAKNTLVFYAVSFTLGGSITAICNLLNIWQNSRHIVINGTFDTIYGDLPFGLFVILALGCSVFSVISGKIIKKNTEKQICSLEIGIKNGSVKLEALVDSGNLLKDPISSKPVVIVTFNSLRPILPVEMLNVFKNKDISTDHGILKDAKIRFIPTSTVCGQGLLFAFCPDFIKINDSIADAYIAIDSMQNSFGEYNAIVPVSLI
ncbi:MAG: sigma-E processing peptidase SpoIIGA [Clostridia bacterium]|nr:sigma-E processing peptidase SpoIIGA [Clostridia bacterium]